MSIPERASRRGDVGDPAPRGREAAAIVDRLLGETWCTALAAGLSAPEAVVVCRVMSFRVTDAMESGVMDMGWIPDQRRPVEARMFSRTLGEEVERARRVAAWEATVMPSRPSSVSTP